MRTRAGGVTESTCSCSESKNPKGRRQVSGANMADVVKPLCARKVSNEATFSRVETVLYPLGDVDASPCIKIEVYSSRCQVKQHKVLKH